MMCTTGRGDVADRIFWTTCSFRLLKFLFALPSASVKSVPFFPTWRFSYGQEIKASRVDDSRRSYVEDRSQKEDTGVKHRQNIETDRRSHPPKGIQSRPVPRFASLIQFNQFNGQEAPPIGG